jgi:hypothetical protein
LPGGIGFAFTGAASNSKGADMRTLIVAGSLALGIAGNGIQV